MKIPCDKCLVFPCCRDTCQSFRKAMKYHGLNLDKLRPYIYSKNNHLRKHIPIQIIKHYNNHIKVWNRGITISDLIYDRNEKD